MVEQLYLTQNHPFEKKMKVQPDEQSHGLYCGYG